MRGQSRNTGPVVLWAIARDGALGETASAHAIRVFVGIKSVSDCEWLQRRLSLRVFFHSPMYLALKRCSMHCCIDRMILGQPGDCHFFRSSSVVRNRPTSYVLDLCSGECGEGDLAGQGQRPSRGHGPSVHAGDYACCSFQSPPHRSIDMVLGQPRFVSSSSSYSSFL